MTTKRTKKGQGETIDKGGVSIPPPPEIVHPGASWSEIYPMETRQGKMLPDNVHYWDGGLQINQATPGDKLETKIEQLLHQHESTGEKTAPLLYTAREQGVKESTNIRTDRWEIAVAAATRVAKSYMARREERIKAGKEPDKAPEQNQTRQGEAKPETNAGEQKTQ